MGKKIIRNDKLNELVINLISIYERIKWVSNKYVTFIYKFNPSNLKLPSNKSLKMMEKNIRMNHLNFFDQKIYDWYCNGTNYEYKPSEKKYKIEIIDKSFSFLLWIKCIDSNELVILYKFKQLRNLLVHSLENYCQLFDVNYDTSQPILSKQICDRIDEIKRDIPKIINKIFTYMQNEEKNLKIAFLDKSDLAWINTDTNH
ncbi:MAG: hypothetical protein LBL60_01805 [Mycoplasmataceae bacterium]|jgi:hypothetical protein|nr:hypothetical protein [Mycoplasmataceae bacterium]